MKDYSEYSVEDFNRAFMRFYEALTYGKQPVKSPTAFLLGGQGGSGKSSIHEYLSSEIGNIVSIDGDQFRREHPNYEMIQKIYGKDAANITQSFANNITNAMIEKLSDEGYNLVIEGTCRRADVPLKTCGDLKEKGYRVEMAIMCADKEEAWQSTLDRAEKMRELGLTPREVPKEKYQETIIALPGNVSILYQSGAFDDITLFNRQLEELYKFSRTPEHDPADIFYHCLHSRSDEFYRPRSSNPVAVLLYANSLDAASQGTADDAKKTDIRFAGTRCPKRSLRLRKSRSKPSPMIKNAVPRSGNGAAEMSANGYFVNLFWCFNAPEAS